MPVREWPDVPEGFEDEFGPINSEVYEAAVKLWPRAMSFARLVLHDCESAHALLMKAAAGVTKSRLTDRASLGFDSERHLASYLFTAFQRLVFKEKRKRSRFVSLDEQINFSGDEVERIERRILIEELMKRMPPEMRAIYERLAVGYSYEEIASMMTEEGGGSLVTASVLRQRFHRFLNALIREIQGEPDAPTDSP